MEWTSLISPCNIVYASLYRRTVLFHFRHAPLSGDAGRSMTAHWGSAPPPHSPLPVIPGAVLSGKGRASPFPAWAALPSWRPLRDRAHRWLRWRSPPSPRTITLMLRPWRCVALGAWAYFCPPPKGQQVVLGASRDFCCCRYDFCWKYKYLQRTWITYSLRTIM